jgi:hypothetical protein
MQDTLIGNIAAAENACSFPWRLLNGMAGGHDSESIFPEQR